MNYKVVVAVIVVLIAVATSIITYHMNKDIVLQQSSDFVIKNDDAEINSNIILSNLSNGTLVIQLYNPNKEPIRIVPATIQYTIDPDKKIIWIPNYNNEKFQLIIGSNSDVYEYGEGNWTIENGKVYVNETWGKLEAYPHTIACSQWVYFNITSYQDFKNIDVLWGFNTMITKTTKVEWYNPHYVNTTSNHSRQINNVTDIIVSTEPCECGNEYNSIKRDVTYHTGNESITETVCFDSYEQDGNNYTIHWETRHSRIENWQDISSNLNTLTHDYQGMNKWWYVTNFAVEPYQTYVCRAWVEVPVSLSRSTGKYFFAVKRSSESLSDAIAAGHFMGLDPWWNSTFDKKRAILINNTIGDSVTDYQLISVNLSSFNINATSARIVNESSSTEIPCWNESVDANGNLEYIWCNFSNLPNGSWINSTYYIYYQSSPIVSSASDGNATFLQCTGFQNSNYLGVLDVDPTSFIFESIARQTVQTSSDTCNIGMSDNQGDQVWVDAYSPAGNSRRFITRNDYAQTQQSDTPQWTTDQWYRVKIVKQAATVSAWMDDDQVGSAITTTLPDVNMGIYMREGGSNHMEIEWAFVRKYTANEPEPWTVGAEEEHSNITITSYAPSSPVTATTGDTQLFNVTTDNSSQCRWYIDGNLVQTNATPDTNFSYYNASLSQGLNQNFTAVVNHTTSADNNSQIWDVDVYPPIQITNYSTTYEIYEFENITIDFDYTGGQGGPYTFATNSPNGTMNSTTGVWNWTTYYGDEGVYAWSFNVTDATSGDVATANPIITVKAYPGPWLPDNFQDHPGDDPSDMWINYLTYSTGGVFGSHTYTSNQLIDDKGVIYSKSLALESYAYVYGKNNQWTKAYSHSYNNIPYLSDYWSFIYRGNKRVTDDAPVSSDQDYGFFVAFYDVNGVQTGSTVDLKNYMVDNSTIEFLRSSGNMYLYVNGTYNSNLFVCDQPAYIEFISYAYAKVPAYATNVDSSERHTVYIDDVSCTNFGDGYVVGVGSSESPNHWMNVNSNDEIDLEYNIYTIYDFGDWTDYAYSATVTHLDTSTLINTTTLPEVIPNGFVIYNKTTLFTPGYGTYKFDLYKDNVLMDSDYITYLTLTDSGTLVYDNIAYLVEETANASYTIGGYDATNYEYYIKTYEINTGLMNTTQLSSSTGNFDLYLDPVSYETGTYYSLLTKKSKSTGTEYSIAYDTFDITTEVGFTGITYNAVNHSVIPITSVSLYQGVTWYNDTSNALGLYDIDDMSNNIEVTFNAEKSGYIHEAFSATPTISQEYTVDLYLFPDTNITNGTSIIEGVTVDYPWHQLVPSCTVYISNASWNDSTATNTYGYYNFTGLAPGTYSLYANKTGFVNSTLTEKTTTANNVTIHNPLMYEQYLLTVRALDTTTSAYLDTFTATVDSEEYDATNGYAYFNITYGLKTVYATAADYEQGSYNVLMNQDRNVTVPMTPTTEGYLITQPHYVLFIVQDIVGTKYEGVTTTVYQYGNSTALFSNSTGSDGGVGFELSETTQYTLTFINTGYGINETFSLYPILNEYVVIVASNISFVTETPDANLTDVNITYTDVEWSIQNLTGDYLTNDLGVGPTGQGVIAATICWAACTVACGVPTGIIIGLLACLGIVSWVMVLFVWLTMVSMYILGGKIG